MHELASAGNKRMLIRGSRIYGEDAGDVLIEQGMISAIAPELRNDQDDTDVIDATNLVLLPGLVDLHTHLREPGSIPLAETIESGTLAAAAGGYTAVFAMANTAPVADTVEVVEFVADTGRSCGHCDVFAVGAVTVGLLGRDLAPLEDMAASRSRVRVFSDDGKCVENPAHVQEALSRIGAVGGVFAQHAQCSALAGAGQVNAGVVAEQLGLPPWPSVGEESVVARDVILAGATLGARLHICHVSTAGTVEIVRWAKQRGLPVTAEVTPHHLALPDSACLAGDTDFKVNPPLRGASDVAALRDALEEGIIDVVATDHAPHSVAAKARPWEQAPPGMLGLETALAVVARTMVEPGRMTWRNVADRMSVAPAQIGRIDQQHGRPIRVGEKATLCLVDPNDPWEVRSDDLLSHSSNTPFAGMSFRARVIATLLQGKPTYDLRSLFRSGRTYS